MPKPDHIFDLERRKLSLEEELSKALLQYSSEDVLIADLERRRLILRDELERLLHEAPDGKGLH